MQFTAKLHPMNACCHMRVTASNAQKEEEAKNAKKEWWETSSSSDADGEEESNSRREVIVKVNQVLFVSKPSGFTGGATGTNIDDNQGVLTCT
jgi:hypothetical protein